MRRLAARFTLVVFAFDIRAMELITILNHCHRHRALSTRMPASARQEDHRSGGAPRQGAAAVCSVATSRAGLRSSSEAALEFILLGILVLAVPMRRVNCRNCGMVVVEEFLGRCKHQLSRPTCSSWPVGTQTFLKETAETFHTSWTGV